MGKTPQAILTIDDLERGIEIIHFYLGQIHDAMRLIEKRNILRQKSPSGLCCWPKPWSTCGPIFKTGASL
jgi:hypothetical protein